MELKKKKVLIIDDEVDFANLLARRIRLDGHDALCYYQGENAVDTANEIQPDLILLDISLPDISGLEVYEHLKGHENTKSIPVVFLSAFPDREDYCLYTLKADGFLKKPCDSALILKMIRSIIRPNVN